jgi:hypothetical protein
MWYHFVLTKQPSRKFCANSVHEADGQTKPQHWRSARLSAAWYYEKAVKRDSDTKLEHRMIKIEPLFATDCTQTRALLRHQNERMP